MLQLAIEMLCDLFFQHVVVTCRGQVTLCVTIRVGSVSVTPAWAPVPATHVCLITMVTTTGLT